MMSIKFFYIKIALLLAISSFYGHCYAELIIGTGATCAVEPEKAALECLNAAQMYLGNVAPKLVLTFTSYYGKDADRYLETLAGKLPKDIIFGCNTYRVIGNNNLDWGPGACLLLIAGDLAHEAVLMKETKKHSNYPVLGEETAKELKEKNPDLMFIFGEIHTTKLGKTLEGVYKIINVDVPTIGGAAPRVPLGVDDEYLSEKSEPFGTSYYRGGQISNSAILLTLKGDIKVLSYAYHKIEEPRRLMKSDDIFMRGKTLIKQLFENGNIRDRVKLVFTAECGAWFEMGPLGVRKQFEMYADYLPAYCRFFGFGSGGEIYKVAGAKSYSSGGGVASLWAIGSKSETKKDWQLAFCDGFERGEVGPDWFMNYCIWDIDAGALRLRNANAFGPHIILKKKLDTANLRIEYDVICKRMPGDVGCFVGSVPSGYYFQVGGDYGRKCRVLVQDQSLFPAEIEIATGKWYHVTCERTGGHVKISVNGKVICEGDTGNYQVDPYIGLLAYTPGTCFDNVKIYVKGE